MIALPLFIAHFIKDDFYEHYRIVNFSKDHFYYCYIPCRNLYNLIEILSS